MFIGCGGNVGKSGEFRILKYINEFYSPSPYLDIIELVVFDVGANIGKYTNMIYEAIGNRAKIYSFEPSKITYQTMMRYIEKIPNVIGKENTVLTLYSDIDESGLASLYRRNLEHFNIKYECFVTTNFFARRKNLP
jgi:hypothetical protein